MAAHRDFRVRQEPAHRCLAEPPLTTVRRVQERRTRRTAVQDTPAPLPFLLAFRLIKHSGRSCECSSSADFLRTAPVPHNCLRSVTPSFFSFRPSRSLDTNQFPVATRNDGHGNWLCIDQSITHSRHYASIPLITSVPSHLCCAAPRFF